MLSLFNKVKSFISKNDSFFLILVIILVGIFASRSLFLPGFYSSHDGVSHVIRLVKFHEGLMDGQIIPRWSKGLAFGLGSPVLLFYGQLPYMVGLIPKLLGFSYSSSIEIVFSLSLIISGITFYLWAKEISNKSAALIGSILYMYAPYRFLDIYVRGEYPESFGFIFPPLMLLALYKIFYTSEKIGFILGIISLSGIILSHNAMALFFATVYILYALGLFFIKRDKKKLIVASVSFIFSLIITSFYWVPVIFEKKFANLDLLNQSSAYKINFVVFKEIIYSKWAWGPIGSTSPMSLQVGLVQQVFFILSVIIFTVFIFRKKKIGKLLIHFMRRLGLNFPNRIERVDKLHFSLFNFLFLFSTFLMAQKSQFLDKIPLLSFILYPWRFLAVIVFSLAIISTLVVKLLKPSFIYLLLVIIAVLYVNRNYSQLVGRIYENNSYYETYDDTADMWGEFLPLNANLEVINNCRDNGCKFEKIILSKEIYVEAVKDRSNLLQFNYQSQEDFLVTVNIYYYPQWKVYVDKISNNQIFVNEIGTMDINLPKGNHAFEMRFENSNLQNVFLIVSALGFVGLGIYLRCLKK